MDSLLKRTANGFVSFCAKCNAYHLEFGNLFFRFTDDEFRHFYRYISSIDGEYYQDLNRNMRNVRKIFLRMPIQGFYCALHLEELIELKRLVDFSTTENETNLSIHLEHYSLN
ncbi:hypothetical protein JN06_02725 [Bacteroides zoogleoformans]|mgnify:CR=1 FL=1|uniref:Uncharacterized protein n=1 Tax=Bacteroides zoogleoformans TaxID=28119 RepID=A0ABN5INU9_9BACE|nr:DUF6686 family protein [Bacteroides zoogleoformans]AVM53638.1 hypothetical protein C4H11_12575 [Bacteroides zoogleoformans]TWJ08053.1 hypothetical protein JN06_02725 [Bacteroides zoogleoformans]